MKRVALLVVVVSAVLSFLFVRGTVKAGQNGWPPPNPGCHYIGNSACGGDDKGQCTPQERFMSQQCNNGQTIHDCRADDYCGKTSKGRVNITGVWQGGGYQILQHGDSFSIIGGAAGPAQGAFTGPRTITVTWPQAHATFNGVIGGTDPHHPVTIQWDHPANNIWRRP
jgi:hypothetical protein